MIKTDYLPLFEGLDFSRIKPRVLVAYYDFPFEDYYHQMLKLYVHPWIVADPQVGHLWSEKLYNPDGSRAKPMRGYNWYTFRCHPYRYYARKPSKTGKTTWVIPAHEVPITNPLNWLRLLNGKHCLGIRDDAVLADGSQSQVRNKLLVDVDVDCPIVGAVPFYQLPEREAVLDCVFSVLENLPGYEDVDLTPRIFSSGSGFWLHYYLTDLTTVEVLKGLFDAIRNQINYADRKVPTQVRVCSNNLDSQTCRVPLSWHEDVDGIALPLNRRGDVLDEPISALLSMEPWMDPSALWKEGFTSPEQVVEHELGLLEKSRSVSDYEVENFTLSMPTRGVYQPGVSKIRRVVVQEAVEEHNEAVVKPPPLYNCVTSVPWESLASKTPIIRQERGEAPYSNVKTLTEFLNGFEIDSEHSKGEESPARHISVLQVSRGAQQILKLERGQRFEALRHGAADRSLLDLRNRGCSSQEIEEADILNNIPGLEWDGKDLTDWTPMLSSKIAHYAEWSGGSDSSLSSAEVEHAYSRAWRIAEALRSRLPKQNHTATEEIAKLVFVLFLDSITRGGTFWVSYRALLVQTEQYPKTVRDDDFQSKDVKAVFGLMQKLMDSSFPFLTLVQVGDIRAANTYEINWAWVEENFPIEGAN
jgi:hypothetical protein